MCTPDIDKLRHHCMFLREALLHKCQTESNLRSRLSKCTKVKRELLDIIKELQKSEMSNEGLGVIEERFQGVELELHKSLVSKKGRTTKFSQGQHPPSKFNDKYFCQKIHNSQADIFLF